MMNSSPYFKAIPYVPASLSEIDDQLKSMILGAPTFIDQTMAFPDRNIDTEFKALTDGFALVRKKLGEERYAALIDLAVRAKALFTADQDNTNGKTTQGRELLFDIGDILSEVRRSRVKEKLPDMDGEITGD